MSTGLDLNASIVNLRRLADKLERGEMIVAATPAPVAPAAAPAVAPPPPPPAIVAADPILAAKVTPAAVEAAVAAALEAAAERRVATETQVATEIQVVAEPEIAAEPEVEVDVVAVRAEDLTRLEQVRAEVSELSGRRLSPWTRRRLDDAQAEERAILSRLGFGSYLDVMLAYAAGSSQAELADPQVEARSLQSDSVLSAVAAGGDIDSGGNDEVAVSASDVEVEVEVSASLSVAEAPGVDVVDDADDIEVVEDDGAGVPLHVMGDVEAPPTVEDWLRSSSFGAALEANVGA